MPLSLESMSKKLRSKKNEKLYHPRLDTYCWGERRYHGNLGSTISQYPSRVDQTSRMERRWCPRSKLLGIAQKFLPHTCRPGLLSEFPRRVIVVKAGVPSLVSLVSSGCIVDVRDHTKVQLMPRLLRHPGSSRSLRLLKTRNWLTINTERRVLPQTYQALRLIPCP